MTFNFLNIKLYPSVKNKFDAIFNWINSVVKFQQPVTLTYASTITWNVGDYYNAQVTLTGSATLSVTGLQPGCYGTLKVIQGGSGSYTLTLPSSSKVSGGGAGVITLSTSVGAIDVIGFYYDGTNLLWNAQLDFT